MGFSASCRAPKGISPQSQSTRREFFGLLGKAGLLLSTGGLGAYAQSPHPSKDDNRFVFTRLMYDGGDWDTDTQGGAGNPGGSELQLLKRVEATTNIPVHVGEHFLRADNPKIALYPFLYCTGHSRIWFSGSERDSLRDLLLNGSFLFAEDCLGRGEFEGAFKSEIRAILPEYPLKKIPMDHPLYRSPFHIDRILGGDKRLHDYMEGIEIDGRLAVVFTDNDLGCAWEGHPCSPGGEEQRAHAFRVSINMVTYALTM